MGRGNFRERQKGKLVQRILQAFDEIQTLSEQCSKHPREYWPKGADGCPCINRLDWVIARADEAIYLLGSGYSLIKWSTWYFRSSTVNPFFPRKQLDTYSVPNSIKAMTNRYRIARRRSKLKHEDARCYIYADGTTRAGAGPRL